MDKQELINELKKILKEDGAQKEAAHFLSQIDLRESLGHLISLLKPSDPEQSKEKNISKEKKIGIIQILGDTKQTRGLDQKLNIKLIESLKEMLTEQNEEIALSALYSLIKIHDPKVIPILEDAVKIKKTKATAIEGLGKMADLIPAEKREKLLNFLSNSLNDKEIKEATIISLGKIGNKKAVPCLISSFKNSDKEIKKTIIQSLGKIGGKEATEFLFEKLKEEKEIKAEIIIELERLYLS